MIHQFSFPTTIRFGPGARKEISEHLKAGGFRRPLVVTDRGIAPLPMTGEIASILKNAGLEASVFSDIGGNPVKSQAEAGAAAYRAHKADCIVGLGGGAALDVAKAIALLVSHPGDLFDYEDGPGKPITGDIPYWIALPTTAGTGSEVGRSSVISDEKSHVKKIIFSPKLLARMVFADPELTLDLPAKITAATGMDALTHCVEAYLAKDFHPICDGVALEGLRYAAKALPLCMTAPKNTEARGEMLLASIMGAIAFQKGLGLTHSCAHALGTVVDMHHGLANGIMIDTALAFNVPAAPERFRTLAHAAGLPGRDAMEFITWLTELKRTLGIPSLAEAGVKADQLDRLAQLAFEDSCHQNNPRPVTKADFVSIFSMALAAKV